MTEQNTLLISDLQKKAEAGDALTQFALGLYYFPEAVWKDKEGWEFIDSLYSKYQIGSFGGECIELEIYSAFELVKTNNVENVESAFAWFKKAAEQGRAEAQYAIARCYYEGKGTEQNDKLAFEWAKKSGDQHFAEAYSLLGDIYSQGRGVGQDDKRALVCYEKADVAGVKNARLKKRDMLLTGKGIENYDDRREAIKEFINDVSNKLRNGANHLVETLEKECPLNKDGEDPFEEFLEWLNESSDSLTGLLKNSSLAAIDNDESSNKLKQELESEIERKEALQKALHDKEKEMLSFFTHTMRNALSTAPESLRQAIHLLGSDVYEKDTKHYKAINKIAALFSTLSLTDCLIDTFKQSISDPQEFKQSWRLDHSGDASPRWVIASALKQSLNRITFMSDTNELRKLLSSQETALVKATRKAFIEDVLPLNVDQQGVDAFFEWSYNHIPTIEVVISNADNLSFGVNQIRFSLLFAITSELILNALKYWDGENRIQIGWQLAEQDNYVFSVTNHCKANAASNLAGTHKGLAFIKRLVELLGDQAHFVCKTEDQLFTTELILNKALFDEES
ncbi:MAG: hypothetical protein Q7U98_19705 [Methylicorpusculum sp.]|uniref:hypothetical protein n=1 Tax=Methylicorpusculum sp. TaxID=2713644 RepID=UPI0027218D1B|nr:hypothetical protein [Methylicorpusculum sp.]MDO8941388.1 hypothetical protein [Methylicorpusculum sp.]MDP2203021.1 hypothetical protein [Methylicorpusculum sp.]